MLERPRQIGHERGGFEISAEFVGRAAPQAAVKLEEQI
jgi:hypothetical protein